MADRALSLKQEAFVAAYIGEANGNATEAARRAGYRGSGATLAVVGHENLTKPKVAAAIAEHRAAVVAKGLASQENRLEEYNARWRLLQTVREERARDPETAALPGGSTGLIVKQLKSVKHSYDSDPEDEDDKGRVVVLERWEAVIDAAYLREMRELEKQAAVELGQMGADATAVAVAVNVQPTILREFRVVRDVPLAPVRDDHS